MKRHSIKILAIISILFITRAYAQEDNSNIDGKFYQQEMQRYKTIFQNQVQGINATQSIDAKYYKLDLKITTSPQYLKGMLAMNAVSRQDNLSAITLDLMSALTIDSVRVGGIKTSFTQHPTSFDLTLDRLYNSGELINVEVFYQGVPGSSGFGSFEFSSHLSVPWVWTLSEPYGAKDWWPCNDHPSDKADSADIYVTCDASYKVGSNGSLISIADNGDGTATHYWKTIYPISTYLIAVALTNFSEFSNWFKYTPTDSMVVLNYVLPEHLSSAQSGLPVAVTGLTIFSNLFGLYPFINEKYGHAEFGWGGGMEHQTMTYLGGFSEGLVIHELSHQWFGDMITCGTWPDLWLNEGFATYCEALYYEKKYGMSTYWSSMNSKMNSAKTATGTLYLQDTSSVGYMFNGARVYNKGASALHMLRHVVGDTMFFHSMYNYANDPNYKFGTATTADFQSVFEAITGKDLNYFFNEWLYGEKYPRYTYGWTSEPSLAGYTVTIGLSQTTATTNPTFFTMPIDFKIYSTGWDTTVVLFNDQSPQTFSFDVSHHPTSVQLDPQGWILKTKDTLRSFTVSPTSRNFGLVYVNFSKKDSVTVYNTGLTTLEIGLVFSDLDEFIVDPTSATIPAGANKKFYITFSPTSEGMKTAQITFMHNGATSPDQVTVTGIATFPPVYVAGGWNMVSLPIRVTDNRSSIVFPTAIPPVYRYDKVLGYIPSDSIYTGIGYWGKFPGKDTIGVSGEIIHSDTFDVIEGWNMIGSIFDTIDATSIVSEPPDIIVSDYFYYKDSYCIADSIIAGKGYWVKVNLAGSLILNSSSMMKVNTTQRDIRQDFNKLIFRDSKGRSQELYFGNQPENITLGRYELPPMPPAGGFDARFATSRYMEFFDGNKTKEIPLSISTSSYPVTITWKLNHENEYAASLIIDGKETKLNNTSQSTIVSQSGTQSAIKLKLSPTYTTESPKEYSLEQNYPNPFNPTTNFRFRIAFASGGAFVSLKVYDVLGREIAVLVNEVKQQGVYDVLWDASEFSSGVYNYRLSVTPLASRDLAPTSRNGKTDGTTLVRKMILAR